ncbi:hypothetical protein ACFL1X_04555 [Candidatus Hydrogenedentota bacterium]
MVIREDRDKLIEIIERYLSEETSAFEFDDELDTVRDSRDGTVSKIAWELWCAYDDLKNHKVVADKELWDFLQRLLLVLKSDSEIIEETRKQWHFSQLIALACAVICIAAFVKDSSVGVLACFVLWPITLVTSKLRDWAEEKLLRDVRKECMPFSNVSEIRTTVRMTRGFSKTKYPAHLRKRRARLASSQILLNIQVYLSWLMYTPLVALAQVRPISVCWPQVSLPEE